MTIEAGLRVDMVAVAVRAFAKTAASHSTSGVCDTRPDVQTITKYTML